MTFFTLFILVFGCFFFNASSSVLESDLSVSSLRSDSSFKSKSGLSSSRRPNKLDSILVIQQSMNAVSRLPL